MPTTSKAASRRDADKLALLRTRIRARIAKAHVESAQVRQR